MPAQPAKPSRPSPRPRPGPKLKTLALALLANLILGLSIPASADPASAAELPVPLDDLRAFAEVLDRVRTAYVEDVSDTELVENAIRGMLDGLDPHSGYLDQDAYQALQESTLGQFNGVGIEVEMTAGEVRVVAPIDGSPAEAAGLQPGDVILAINNTSMVGASLAAAVHAMRGPAGTEVQLVLRRPGPERHQDRVLDINLTRQAIAIDSVRGRLLEPDFAYLRVAQFQTTTGRELQQELADLISSNKAPLRGLVLDLRNNPGGVLQASVEVSDTFLEQGVIVYTKGRMANAELRFNASIGDTLNGAPVVVLINGSSASAAEIVAGALQDHHRAVILGSRSFGKGSVQTVLPLRGDRAIKLTTARYYTPGGRSIHNTGITPDIAVEPQKGTDAPLDEALTVLKGYHLLSLKTEGTDP